MKKYINPLNYLIYFYKKIQLLRFIYIDKKIYSKKYIQKNLKKIHDLDSLINFHFDKYVKYELVGITKKIYKINTFSKLISFHSNPFNDTKSPNKIMFKLALEQFNSQPLNILETGSLAHGTKSSILFMFYIQIFGGSFTTVDINPEIKKNYSYLEDENIAFHSSDSVEFIRNLKSDEISQFDFVYLDSFDLDFSNPHPSQEHTFKEFNLLKDNLKKDTLILIDDTPDRYSKFNLNADNPHNFIPGKGRTILDYLKENQSKFSILYHDYSVLLKKLN